jgi:hypothetical protein
MLICPYCKAELDGEDKFYVDESGEEYACEFCIDDYFLSEIKYNARIQLSVNQINERNGL